MKLFQYQKIDMYSLQSIINNTIYFANPESFNDPFDSRLFYKSFNSIDEFSKIIEDEFKNGSITHEELIEYKENINDKNITTPEFINSLLTIPMRQKKYASLRVSCFSEKWNNIQMWGHYADKYKGICLGFNAIDDNKNNEKCYIPMNDINNSLQLVNGIYYLPLHKVNYTKEPIESIDLHSKNDFVKKYKYFLTTKEENWRYEKEWRGFIQEEDSNTKTLMYDSKCLTDIVFGLRCEENNIKMVVNILKMKGNIGSINFWKIKESESKYELVRNEVVV